MNTLILGQTATNSSTSSASSINAPAICNHSGVSGTPQPSYFELQPLLPLVSNMNANRAYWFNQSTIVARTIKIVRDLALQQPENEQKTVQLFELLAIEDNSSAAATLVGDYYLTKGDKETAVNWYGRAAKQNNIDAIFRMGLCCYLYDPKLYECAHYLFLKAAEKQQPLAQYALFLCYKYGQGVTQDSSKAAMWLEQAVASSLNIGKNRYIYNCYTRLIDQTIAATQKHNLLMRKYAWDHVTINKELAEYFAEKYMSSHNTEATNMLKLTHESKEIKQSLTYHAVTLNDFKNFLDFYFRTKQQFSDLHIDDSVIKSLYEYFANSHKQQLKTALDAGQLLMLTSLLEKLVCCEKNDRSDYIRSLQIKIANAFNFKVLAAYEFVTLDLNQMVAKNTPFIAKLDELCAIKIAGFLELKDIASLIQTDRFWHTTLTKYEKRIKIHNELSALFIGTERFAHYKSRNHYVQQILILLMMLGLVWCASRSENSSWIRVLSGLLALGLVVYGKKSYGLHQEYKNFGLLKNNPHPKLDKAIATTIATLCKLYLQLLTIVEDCSKNITPEEIALKLVPHPSRANNLTTIEILLGQFKAWMATLNTIIPQNKISLLSPTTQNDLKHLQEINKQLLPKIESYTNVLLEWVKKRQYLTAIKDSANQEQKDTGNFFSTLKKEILFANFFLPDFKNALLPLTENPPVPNKLTARGLGNQ